MKLSFCDTHSHLYLEQFSEDIEEVVSNAKAKDIDKIYLPNIDSKTINAMLKLKDANPDFFEVMAGLHPTDVKGNYVEELAIVEKELEKDIYCAVGEIGIDLYWDKTFLQEQIFAFEQQVQWSIDKKLPFVIHARDSFDEIFNSLRKFRPEDLKGIFHSFTGKLDQAKTALSLGDFKLGINGIVTFKNADLDTVVEKVGIQHLVLETDSPFLAPTPFRGKRNESAYLIYIAQKLADIFAISLHEVAEVTTKNAEYIFKK